jgi:hypothetical protein
MTTMLTTSPTRTPRRFIALSTIALLAGLISPIFASAPAEAAATAQVQFCAKWTNGAVYADLPVTLKKWNGNGWTSVRNGKSGANGCGVFSSVEANAYYAVEVYWTQGRCYAPFMNVYQGFSANGYVRDSQRLMVGTMYVKPTRIC